MSTPLFRYVRLEGRRLSPEGFGGREPRYEEVYKLYLSSGFRVDSRDYVAIELGSGASREVLWLSRGTYERSRGVLGPTRTYYVGHEGVTLTSARGAWLVINEPKPTSCPPGFSGECFLVETRLSRSLGLGPFVIEGNYLFKAVKGSFIEVGYVSKYMYVIIPYDRVRRRFLSEGELRGTLLYRNYLSRGEVVEVLRSVSKHLRREWWYVERMRGEVFSKYKVMWRDVAKEFKVAVDTEGAIPDYTVNYVVVSSEEEANYLMTTLLSPQINEVVKELSPWVGHVQPRFLRYFKIPKYNPQNPIHKALANKGREIRSKKKLSKEDLKEIEELINKLTTQEQPN